MKVSVLNAFHGRNFRTWRTPDTCPQLSLCRDDCKWLDIFLKILNVWHVSQKYTNLTQSTKELSDFVISSIILKYFVNILVTTAVKYFALMSHIFNHISSLYHDWLKNITASMPEKGLRENYNLVPGTDCSRDLVLLFSRFVSQSMVLTFRNKKSLGTNKNW